VGFASVRPPAPARPRPPRRARRPPARARRRRRRFGLFTDGND
jgi:hypothetical protein